MASTMNIELYSVKGFTGSALRQKLQDKLADHQLPYTVTEIHEVDQFIKAGLAAVPAFRIGDHIIQHLPDQDPDDTVKRVVDHLLADRTGTVLVPVDFSAESQHAIDYAVMLASSMKTGITLAHIHEQINDPVSSVALNMQLLGERRQILDDLVANLKVEFQEKDIQIPVTSYFGVGNPSGSLIELLENGPYALMVIGTKASDTVVRRLFGTISSRVSRHSSKPVLVVPADSKVSFPGRIVIGLTEDLLDNGTLEYILRFGARKNAIFDFIHISQGPEDEKSFISLKRRLHEKLVLHRDLLCGYNIRQIHDDDDPVHEQLTDYAEDVHAGMLVLVTHQRGLLEALFHNSVTRKVLYEPEIPVLILSH